MRDSFELAINVLLSACESLDDMLDLLTNIELDTNNEEITIICEEIRDALCEKERSDKGERAGGVLCRNKEWIDDGDRQEKPNEVNEGK